MKTCELSSEYEDTGENLDILWTKQKTTAYFCLSITLIIETLCCCIYLLYVCVHWI